MLKCAGRLLTMLLCVCLCFGALAETPEATPAVSYLENGLIVTPVPPLDEPSQTPDVSETPVSPMLSPVLEDEPLTARDDLINRIIATGQKLFEKAGGHPQRAHYKSDIYVCKNFTTYVFNQNKADFRMAEYPKTKLVIPANLPSEKCKPYCYGYAWKSISASKGNPFVVAAQFLYDTGLSEEENMEKALAFMREIKRGDFFQMTANYSAGTGAHSAIMIRDYDPTTDKVYWMDSNMRGTRRDGVRYGYVQFDAEASIQWWAEAFCQKKRGATIYRLRDDIVYAADVQ